MNDSIQALTLAFTLGAFMAMLARANHYANNPCEIVKKEDGTVHWYWMAFINIVAVLIGGTVSMFAVMALNYLGWLQSGNFSLFVAGALGVAADRIFTMAQERLYKKADNTMEDFGF